MARFDLTGFERSVIQPLLPTKVHGVRRASKRGDAMYYEVVSQCVRTLKTIEIWLDRAEAHTAAKKFDVDDKSARQVVRAVPHP